MVHFIVRVVVQQEMEFKIEAGSRSSALRDEAIKRTFVESGPQWEGAHIIAKKRIVGREFQ